LLLQQFGELFLIRVVDFRQFSELVSDKGGLACDILLVEVAPVCEVVLEVLHVLLGLEVDFGMQGDEFWLARGVLDQPVVLLVEHEEEELVEVVPILEEDAFIIVIVAAEH
jgi:hypothetical protein